MIMQLVMVRDDAMCLPRGVKWNATRLNFGAIFCNIAILIKKGSSVTIRSSNFGVYESRRLHRALCHI